MLCCMRMGRSNIIHLLNQELWNNGSYPRPPQNSQELPSVLVLLENLWFIGSITTPQFFNKRNCKNTASLPETHTRKSSPTMVFGFGSSGNRAPIRERRVGGPSAASGAVRVTESYEQLRKIGQGGQGKIWIVKRKSDNRILVRKEQKRFHMQGSIPCEMHIFENVLTPHPSIIDFDHANYNKANGSLVLYFEHCQGGDLQHFVPRNGEAGVSENFLWECFVQLADAIAFLHYGYNRFANNPNTPPRGWRRVVHRDVKPENVFLRYKLTSSQVVPQFVLGDFGLATLEEETKDGCGTYQWIGPEIPYLTKQNDVWAVGAIIHALAHGRGPVPSAPRGCSRDDWEMKPSARRPKPLSTAYSSTLNRNMMDCLVMNPRERISSLQLVRNLLAERPRGRR